MKAIETIYKNFRFRSRLEARWAIYFDWLGLNWEYEPEGFDLNGVWYLPDFRVTSPQKQITWYEIKPPITPESEKMAKLEKAFEATTERGDGWHELTTTSFITLSGDPYSILIEKQIKWVCPRCGCLVDDAPDYYNGVYQWTCNPCDYGTPSGAGKPELGLLATVTPHKGNLLTDAAETVNMFSIVKNAAVKARQARFEHGEREK